MTWIECPFLSVALLRRLKTGFQLLTGTKRYFINTKFPRPLSWDQIPYRPGGWVLHQATLEFWVRFPNERNQGKQAHPVLKYRVPHVSQPRHGWAPDPPMVGIRSPIGLVVGTWYLVVMYRGNGGIRRGIYQLQGDDNGHGDGTESSENDRI